jgi:hypothetical protein
VTHEHLVRRFRMEETIRASWHDGCRVFHPEQFTSAGFGTLDEVLQALSEIVEGGRLVLSEVTFFCPDGHPMDPPVIYQHSCPTCGMEVPMESLLVTVKFAVSPAWAEILAK